MKHSHFSKFSLPKLILEGKWLLVFCRRIFNVRLQKKKLKGSWNSLAEWLVWIRQEPAGFARFPCQSYACEGSATPGIWDEIDYWYFSMWRGAWAWSITDGVAADNCLFYFFLPSRTSSLLSHYHGAINRCCIFAFFFCFVLFFLFGRYLRFFCRCYIFCICLRFCVLCFLAISRIKCKKSGTVVRPSCGSSVMRTDFWKSGRDTA